MKETNFQDYFHVEADVNRLIALYKIIKSDFSLDKEKILAKLRCLENPSALEKEIIEKLELADDVKIKAFGEMISRRSK